MPGIGVSDGFPARYGPVITGPSGDDGARLSPTVLGLSLARPSMEAAIDRFLEAIRFIGRQATRNEPPLHEEKHTLLNIADLESFFTSGHIAEPKPTAVKTARLIDNEHMFPVSGGSHSDDYTSWERGISQDADAFVDVNTLDEYITTPPPVAPEAPGGRTTATAQSAGDAHLSRLPQRRLTARSPPVGCRPSTTIRSLVYGGHRQAGLRLRYGRRVRITPESRRSRPFERGSSTRFAVTWE